MRRLSPRKQLSLAAITAVLLTGCSTAGEPDLPPLEKQPVDLVEVREVGAQDYEDPLDQAGIEYDKSLDFLPGGSYSFLVGKEEGYFNVWADEGCEPVPEIYEVEVNDDDQIDTLRLITEEKEEECSYSEESGSHAYYRFSSFDGAEFADDLEVSLEETNPDSLFFQISTLSEGDELYVYDDTPEYLEELPDDTPER